MFYMHKLIAFVICLLTFLIINTSRPITISYAGTSLLCESLCILLTVPQNCDPCGGRSSVSFTDAFQRLGTLSVIKVWMNDWKVSRKTERNITNISDFYRDFRSGDLGTITTKAIFYENCYLECFWKSIFTWRPLYFLRGEINISTVPTLLSWFE